MRNFDTEVIQPVRRILLGLLPGVARALLAREEIRNRITAAADVAFIREFPTARLIPQDLRRRLIRRVLNQLADQIVQPGDATAGADSARVSADDLSLPVAAAAAAAPGAGPQPGDFGFSPEDAQALMSLPPGASVSGILVQPAVKGDAASVASALADALATAQPPPGALPFPAAGSWTVEQIVGNFQVSHPDLVLSASDGFALARAIADHAGITAAEPALDLPAAPVDEDLAAAASSGGAPNPDNDPVYQRSLANPEWSLQMVKAPQAWAYTDARIAQGETFRRSRGEGVRIAHLDTGIASHIEMHRQAGWKGGILWTESENVYDPGRDPRASDPLDGPWFEGVQAGMTPNRGHGTGTITILGSPEGNSSGAKPSAGWVTGTAPAADLIPIRVHITVAQWNQSHMAKAIVLAADKGCHVLTMSMGGPGQLFTNTLHEAVQYAVEKGVVLCTAAGNQVPFVVKPASYDEVVACAGCNIDRQPWSGSSNGKQVSITAPAQYVWRGSANKDDRPPNTMNAGGEHLVVNSSGSGTSYAAPTVAGLAACWLAHHGGWAALRQHYGHPRYIPRAFAHLVRTVAFDTNHHLDTRKFGVGIMDGEKLLKAPLPATSLLMSWPAKGTDDDLAGAASAGLAAASAAAVPQSVEEKVLDVVRSLGVPADQQAGFLARFGPELAYHALYDPILARTPATPARLSGLSDLATASSAAPATAPILRGTAEVLRVAASPELRNALV